MECIYLPNLDDKSFTLDISESESQHLKALRIKDGERILITNGKGKMCIAKIYKDDKYKFNAIVENFFDDFYNETKKRIGLGIGILNDRERFEFALEKAIELGISDFYPLITDYTQKKIVNSQRLKQKAISAMKQSKRSVLANIYEPIKINDINKLNFEKIIVADENGNKPILYMDATSILLLVGPEGGFSSNEIKLLENQNAEKWKLANRRLRSETAAIVALSFLGL